MRGAALFPAQAFDTVFQRCNFTLYLFELQALCAARISSLRWLIRFEARKQVFHRGAQRFGDPNNACESEILPASFQVPNESSVQFAVVGELFLGLESPLNPDLPDTFSETPKNIVHSQSLWDRLPNRLQTVR